MIDEKELSEAASDSAGGLTNAGTNYERLEHIEGFKSGAKWALEKDKWIEKLLRRDEPWNLLDIIKKISNASHILLHEKDYDKHGWEDYEHAYRESLKIIYLLETNLPSPL